MILKSALLLSVLCICSHADTNINNDQHRLAIFDIIDKFKPEIAKIHESLEMLSNDMSEAEEIITSAMTRLHLVAPETDRIMETLTNIVKQTIEESWNENMDASSCLDEEKIAQAKLQESLDDTTKDVTDKFQPRYEKHSKELTILKNRLPEISDKADKLIRACVLQNLLPWQHEALIACIRKDIDKLNVQIGRIGLTTSDINDKVTDIFADMEGKIGEMLENVVHTMVNIIEQLKECISMLTGQTELPTEEPNEVPSEDPITE